LVDNHKVAWHNLIKPFFGQRLNQDENVSGLRELLLFLRKAREFFAKDNNLLLIYKLYVSAVRDNSINVDGNIYFYILKDLDFISLGLEADYKEYLKLAEGAFFIRYASRGHFPTEKQRVVLRAKVEAFLKSNGLYVNEKIDMDYFKNTPDPFVSDEYARKVYKAYCLARLLSRIDVPDDADMVDYMLKDLGFLNKDAEESHLAVGMESSDAAKGLVALKNDLDVMKETLDVLDGLVNYSRGKFKQAGELSKAKYYGFLSVIMPYIVDDLDFIKREFASFERELANVGQCSSKDDLGVLVKDIKTRLSDYDIICNEYDDYMKNSFGEGRCVLSFLNSFTEGALKASEDDSVREYSSGQVFNFLLTIRGVKVGSDKVRKFFLELRQKLLFLVPTDMCDWDNFLILDKTREIAEGKKSALSKANAVMQWVVANFEVTRLGKPLPSASGALKSLKGTKLDKVNLCVALLRAAGIPAKYLVRFPSELLDVSGALGSDQAVAKNKAVFSFSVKFLFEGKWVSFGEDKDVLEKRRVALHIPDLLIDGAYRLKNDKDIALSFAKSG
ncbi:MAG: transglutaminase domain-containing protein, partial [Candidatus Omnitrophota bacterium]